MQLSTEMTLHESAAFEMMKEVYRHIIRNSINEHVVHMVMFQRRVHMTNLRRVHGGYVNPRSTYVAVPVNEFCQQYHVQLLDDPANLILAIKCQEDNSMSVLMILKSEFLEEGGGVLHDANRIVFEVNYAQGCAMCGREPCQVCSRCRQVRYCSRECQLTDIPNHRDGCRILGQVRCQNSP